MSGSLKFKDRLIPWYFVAFFVFLTVVYATMVTIAVRTHTGLVTEHPYEKGLAYNVVVDEADAQSALGWRGEIQLRHSREGGNLLQFELYDKAGKQLKPDKITAQITRPTQAGMDFSVELTSGTVKVDFPVKGLWEVRIFAHVGDKHYQQTKRIVVE